LNGTHQFLAYTDHANLLGDNIDTLKKNTLALTDATKEVGLEINVEKTKYMLLSRHQNADQNQNIKTESRSLENMPQLKFLQTTVADRNVIQEKIKRGLNSGNTCYHPVQNFYILICCLKG
jgi:hypothetical protein